MKVSQRTIHLDPKTILSLRPNGLWVIRRLTGGKHEHSINFAPVVEGHVIARGRVQPPSTLVVSRSELSLRALRELIAPSGAAYNIKVVSGTANARKHRV